MRSYFLRSITTLLSGITQFLLHFVLSNSASSAFYGNFVYGLSLTQKSISFVDPSISNYFFFISLKIKSEKLIRLINNYLIVVLFSLLLSMIWLDKIAVKIAVSFVVVQWIIGVSTKVADVLGDIKVERIRFAAKILMLLALCGFWNTGEGFWAYILLFSIIGIVPFFLGFISTRKVFFKSRTGIDIKEIIGFIFPLLLSSWLLNGFSAIELWYYKSIIGTDGFSTYGAALQIGMVLSLLGVSWLQLLTRDYSERGSLNKGARAYYLLLFSGLIIFLLLNSNLLGQYEIGALPPSIIILSTATAVVTFSNQLRGNISQLDSGSLNYSKTSVYSFLFSIIVIVVVFGFNLGIETLLLRGLYQSFGQSVMLFFKEGKRVPSLVVLDGLLVLISSSAVLF